MKRMSEKEHDEICLSLGSGASRLINITISDAGPLVTGKEYWAYIDADNVAYVPMGNPFSYVLERNEYDIAD